MVRDSDFVSRMWVEALGRLERAERLQRQFFTPVETAGRRACWAPPVDIFEGADAFVVQVALPGVHAGDIDYRLDNHVLAVAGERQPPRALGNAAIRRMELPHGRFERRIALPAFRIAESVFDDGCLTLVLEK